MVPRPPGAQVAYVLLGQVALPRRTPAVYPRGMAGTTFCGTCGTPFDGSRQFCERCGVFLGDPSWAPAAARRCPRCGAPNAPGRADCGRCFANLTTGLDRMWERPPGPVPATPVPPVPLREGACTTCGTVNAPGESFCGSCGQFLEWDGAVASRSAANDRPPAAG